MRGLARIWVGTAVVAAAVYLGTYGYRSYLVHELRKPVLAELTDPDSALFREETYYGPWTVAGGILCGQVNAKNRMGGYAGYRAFDSYNGKALIEPEVLKELRERTGMGTKPCDAEREKLPWWWLRW